MSIPVVKLIALDNLTLGVAPERRALSSDPRSPQPQPTPADLRWSRVEEYLRSRELRPNTRKAYVREFKAFLAWTDKGWHDITARDIDRYKSHLKLNPSHRGGERKAATINLALSALQSLFKWLCARDYIVKDPMLLVEKLKSDPVLPQEWEQTEVTALFEATRQRGQTEQRDRALLWLLLHGLRAREVEALNVGDFDGKRVTIREAKDDSVGQVPLLPEAIRALEGYLSQRRAGDALEPASPLFLSESNNSKGQRLSYWGVYTVVKELAAIAGVANSHPHRGRHTIATEMVSRGIDPLLARQITRHKSEKSYEHYSKRALQKQAEEQFLQAFGQQGLGEQQRPALQPWQESPVVIEQRLAAEQSFYAGMGESHPETESTGSPVQDAGEEEPVFAQSSTGRSTLLTSRVYQLKVTLMGVRPQVWRRIQVHQTVTLAQLHSVLQAAMGWEGDHLHQFSLSEDENITLAELLGDDLFTFSYLYDFGDMWQHEVTVEKWGASESGKRYPVCLTGKRACPPEDCGGDWGYAHLLRVLKNSRHPEYREAKEWVGSGFDPEAFDLKEVNQALRELEFEAATDLASTGRSLPLYLQSQPVGEQLGKAAIALPELAATNPSDQPLQAATVSLKLQLEHPDSGARRKRRRAIESDCLSRYQMQKAGEEYRLTIPYV